MTTPTHSQETAIKRPEYREMKSPSFPGGGHDASSVFIHSRLDDYGLSPQQFRVYCHLARRAGKGAAFPSTATIARTCRLHQQTVRRALQFLVHHRLITRENRVGTTPIYRLTPAYEWHPSGCLTGKPSGSDTPPKLSQSTHSEAMEAPHSETEGAEGHPVEVNKPKEIPPPMVPQRGTQAKGASSCSDSLVEKIYQEYPKKVGKPAAYRAIRRSLGRYRFDFLLERTRLFAQTYAGEQRYIPHPATWFDQERFNDEPSTWSHSTPSSSRAGAREPLRRFDSADYQQSLDHL